jgi:MFS family permease
MSTTDAPIEFARDAASEAERVKTLAAQSAMPWPARKDAHFSLFVMVIVVMFTVLDRTVMSLLIQPIKEDYGLTDSQIALLLGAAFSLPYGFVGLAVARLADTHNRRNIIAASIAFWSVCTMACGVAQGFVSLLLARMGIGAGESGYGPASWSIATDYWPREKVAFATATMAQGAMIGMALAMFLGGATLGLVSGMSPLQTPFGIIKPWQWVFVIVGAPGLFWTLVVLMTKEPPRRGIPAGQKAVKVPLIDIVRWVKGDWRTYLAVVGGMAVKGMMLYVPLTWNATLIHRQFDWSLPKVGMVIGVITLIVGPLGLMAGAKLSERWTKKGMSDGNVRIIVYGLLVTIPLYILYPLMPTPYLVLGLSAICSFVSSLVMGPTVAAAQIITPNPMRAQIGSLIQFCNNVIAFALSPLIVALLTDFLFHDEHALKYSMSLNLGVMGVVALLITYQGLKPYARSYERAVREFAN